MGEEGCCFLIFMFLIFVIIVAFIYKTNNKSKNVKFEKTKTSFEGNSYSQKKKKSLCPSCGKRVDSRGEFCPYCGNELEQSKYNLDKPLNCPQCGRVVKYSGSGAVNCNHCGYSSVEINEFVNEDFNKSQQSEQESVIENQDHNISEKNTGENRKVVCPNCNIEFDRNKKECPACGKLFDEIKKIECRDCETIIQEDLLICPNCDSLIEDNIDDVERYREMKKNYEVWKEMGFDIEVLNDLIKKDEEKFKEKYEKFRKQIEGR